MNLLDLARSALPPGYFSSQLAATTPATPQHLRKPVSPAHQQHVVVDRQRGTRNVVSYDLIDGKGGTLIDPQGSADAVRELIWRFGNRLDWPALLRVFEAREHEADREAAGLVRRLMADRYREASGR